jgi:carboxyl-terminal processing protease
MRRASAIGCGLVLLAGAVIFALYLHRDAAPVAAPNPVAVTWHHGPLRGIGPFPVPETPAGPPPALDQVRQALAQAYYRHVSAAMLSQPSIQLILEQLGDPYTEYLDPDAYQALQEGLSRKYFGVGLRVDRTDGGLLVTSSMNGPARRAGIRPGDVIVSIDGESAEGIPFDRSLALIKGEEGTVVALEVRRPGQKDAMRFNVVRRNIELSAVRSRIFKSAGHRLGYIRIGSFLGNAAERVEATTRGLREKGAEGFIIDLRGDPGGYLTQAVRVASLFLKNGAVCSTSGVNQATRVFTVSGAAVDTERPVVVLVDRRSASAAEIVAGALRDHGRATIVGKRTYGKATVQSLIALSNGGALKLTTATYLTPRGSSIGGRGIHPQVKAADDPDTRPDEGVVAAASVLAGKL